jgi:S-adenosylmethionine decarboxylase
MDIIRTSAQKAGATILHEHYHGFGDGGGMTGILVLSESHISVHTWPEHDFAAFDVFMCGNSAPLLACEYMVKSLMPQNYQIRKECRGLRSRPIIEYNGENQ